MYKIKKVSTSEKRKDGGGDAAEAKAGQKSVQNKNAVGSGSGVSVTRAAIPKVTGPEDPKCKPPAKPFVAP